MSLRHGSGKPPKPCRHCREKPRRSPTVPWCSPQCKKAEKASKAAKRTRPKSVRSQSARTRELREWYARERPAVIERDGRCRWCGGPFEHVHHIRYRSEGVNHDRSNLICLCQQHHDLVHSNKRLYQPLLLELVKLPPETLGHVAFPTNESPS